MLQNYRSLHQACTVYRTNTSKCVVTWTALCIQTDEISLQVTDFWWTYQMWNNTSCNEIMPEVWEFMLRTWNRRLRHMKLKVIAPMSTVQYQYFKEITYQASTHPYNHTFQQYSWFHTLVGTSAEYNYHPQKGSCFACPHTCHMVLTDSSTEVNKASLLKFVLRRQVKML